MTTTVHFEGWFQARFATDPDDTDDPRGAKGWTFAFAGEPDFDRIIRFQTPVAPRTHGPTVDVRVTAVTVAGATVPNHPLIGASVVPSDGPKFEGHNGEIAPDGQEPVFPLHLLIAQGGVSLEVTEWLAFTDLKKPVAHKRFGKGVDQLKPVEIGRLLGGLTPDGFRAQRKATLQADLAIEANPTHRQNLQGRLAQIDADAGMGIAALGFKVNYDFPVPVASRHASDPNQSLGLASPTTSPWQLSWWMGCWDADALCGFIQGNLAVG
jgi:hypothetical protein